MLVQKESEVGGGSIFTLPGWYVRSSPWIGGVLAAAAAVKALIDATLPSKSCGDSACEDATCEEEKKVQ